MKVYLIAYTQLGGEHLDIPNMWDYMKSVDSEVLLDSEDGDALVEFAGRLCYRSWAPYQEGNQKLNANVKKIRVDSKEYIANIIKQGHGSVLEHVNFTFLLEGVSRVLTHELVRHRAGCAYSQESLRYVRLEHLEVVLPEKTEGNELMNQVVESIKKAIVNLNKLLIKDDMPFSEKKRLTSFIRRIAPIGIKTNILFTANARALRHIIKMRTSLGAEVEIRGRISKCS